MMTQSSDRQPQRAAMFVDYDNLHSILTSQSATDVKTSAYVLEILDEVRRYLEEGDDTPTIFGRAYGAFDTRLKAEEDEVPSRLYRTGFKPTYVSEGTQRNASEIQLSIDATQFVIQRTDIKSIVLVTGNRPYLPLARWIREQGRRVLIAAVNPPRSEGTPSHAEEELYLDARNLLSRESREDLLSNAPENGRTYRGTSTVPPRHYQPVNNSVARRTIRITDEHFGQYEEVYLTPLLRKLSEVLGPNHDPKALVSELEAAGAVRLEKREGHPHDYTVLILNDDHPAVEDLSGEPSRRSTDSEDEADPSTPEADTGPAEPDAHVMDDALDSDSVPTPDEATPLADSEANGADAEEDAEAAVSEDAPEDTSWDDDSHPSS